jgi:hypothetical protein
MFNMLKLIKDKLFHRITLIVILALVVSSLAYFGITSHSTKTQTPSRHRLIKDANGDPRLADPALVYSEIVGAAVLLNPSSTLIANIGSSSPATKFADSGLDYFYSDWSVSAGKICITTWQEGDSKGTGNLVLMITTPFVDAQGYWQARWTAKCDSNAFSKAITRTGPIASPRETEIAMTTEFDQAHHNIAQGGLTQSTLSPLGESIWSLYTGTGSFFASAQNIENENLALKSYPLIKDKLLSLIKGKRYGDKQYTVLAQNGTLSLHITQKGKPKAYSIHVSLAFKGIGGSGSLSRNGKLYCFTINAGQSTAVFNNNGIVPKARGCDDKGRVVIG